MDLWTAGLFFRICRRYQIKDYPDRLALIRELTARGKAKYLRDVDPFLAGKRILVIKEKKDNGDLH